MDWGRFFKNWFFLLNRFLLLWFVTLGFLWVFGIVILLLLEVFRWLRIFVRDGFVILYVFGRIWLYFFHGVRAKSCLLHGLDILWTLGSVGWFFPAHTCPVHLFFEKLQTFLCSNYFTFCHIFLNIKVDLLFGKVMIGWVWCFRWLIIFDRWGICWKSILCRIESLFGVTFRRQLCFHKTVLCICRCRCCCWWFFYNLSIKYLDCWSYALLFLIIFKFEILIIIKFKSTKIKSKDSLKELIYLISKQ